MESEFSFSIGDLTRALLDFQDSRMNQEWDVWPRKRIER